VIGFNLFKKHLGVSNDRQEKVIEIVGDATRQSADGVNLLGLKKLRLKILPFLSRLGFF